MHIAYNLPYRTVTCKERYPYKPYRPQRAEARIISCVKNKPEITLREHLQAIQSDGGKARWAGMTAEERSAVARKAVQARWAKKKAFATAQAPDKATDSEPAR